MSVVLTLNVFKIQFTSLAVFIHKS